MMRIWRESGAYVTQMLRAKFAYDVRHVARVECKCCAQQGMLLLISSVNNPTTLALPSNFMIYFFYSLAGCPFLKTIGCPAVASHHDYGYVLSTGRPFVRVSSASQCIHPFISKSPGVFHSPHLHIFQTFGDVSPTSVSPEVSPANSCDESEDSQG
jgi:hypothetical protein